MAANGMRKISRFIANVVLKILPVSRFYGLKRALLNLGGACVAPDAKINGHSVFYGYGTIAVGAKSWVGPGCTFYTDASATIRIGENCDIAPEVSFIVGSHHLGTRARRAGEGYCSDIVVEDGCWIGARATILAGVHIGSGALVAAGALVDSDVPENSLVAGVPARVVKSFEN